MKNSVFLLILVYILVFPVLALQRGPFDIKILWYSGSLLLITLFSYFMISKLKLSCKYIFVTAAMLTTIGFIILCRLNVELFYRQSVWYAVAVSGYFLAITVYNSREDRDRLCFVYYIVSMFLLIITFLFGTTIGGAKSWMYFGGYSFQFSEIIKVLYVLFMSSYFSIRESIKNNDSRIKNNLIKYVFINDFCLLTLVYTYVGFLILQRDWGSAMLFFITYLAFLYVYSKNWFIIILNVAVIIVSCICGYFLLHHIRIRVESFINPWSDISGKGYQITQSLFAIAEGGFFGKGVGLGSPQFIPEVRTDFIFSALCEECGIFTGISVILMFYIMCYRGVKIALQSRIFFNKSVSFGLTVMVFAQTFIIIGGVIKLIPLTGITLPFVSYGGSSLISSYVMIAILSASDSRQVVLDNG